MNTYDKHIILIIITHIIAFHASGQSYINQIKGARLNGLGHQGSSVKGSESWIINPSSLGFESTSSMNISGESRFAGVGIRGTSFNSVLPILHSGVFAVGMEYYGLPEYHQQGFKLGYGRLLSKKLSIGSNVQLIRFIQPSINSQSLFMITLGSMYDLSRTLGLGASIHIPIPSRELSNSYSSPSFNVGIRYTVSDPVIFYTEISKENYYPLNFKIGLEYQIIKAFTLRMGLSTFVHSFSTGISMSIRSRLSIDIASVFYQSLGLTPSLSLKYTFDSPKKSEE